ncbi:hypothetical protein ASPZODRAFT_151692 [Penicilliopsis zonata CBS 506.65]|uniref:Alpha/beta hydrolase fold-3 domain-containing protein n=1 Tax=Penicilliopsis zonata CBS 506.65 TaxID=1073090 RepID=A0A1L9SJ79_9EURO|nr:hypothetical protein ASPZODRAFT_151692 [Penicilliopsis zonata CBS 506.65]OJJ47143.1 hypothetical protein ASPZODRAFT_151692 [Penicilliopsis zonata CBS 506.65]
MLPLPGAPSSSWAVFCERLRRTFNGADPRVCIAFWLFGLINNVLYVIILSAALDLVGPEVPKGVVLLADVIPSFGTKLVAPYFIHMVPYSMRIMICVMLSVLGMSVVALSPAYTDGGAISTKIAGIVLASLSSGAGELSFVALVHYYGPFSLAAWGSGTGAAGLVGAGAYALATSSLGFSVKATLLASACLPAVMMVSFFIVLPRGPLRSVSAGKPEYQSIAGGDRLRDDFEPLEEVEDEGYGNGIRDEQDGLLESSTTGCGHTAANGESIRGQRLTVSIQRVKKLFFPYMVPMLLVYIAEYTINQGVSPTLLFPLKDSPFEHFRAFYPTYNAIYQVGVFLSRSSTPFFRIHNLYLPSLLQVLNLILLILQSLFDFIPSVYLVFAIIFWEGLLGGLVYVNTFAEISDRVPSQEREFSLGATTVNHVLGRPSTKFRKLQVFAVVSFWSYYLLRGNSHGPPGIRKFSARLGGKLTPWQTTVVVLVWLYICRNFSKIVGLESPEPMANLYSRSFFRATWIATAMDAGFWTAMRVKPKWLRDLASLVFTVYYLFAAERADDKVRRVRATLTVDHLRVSWNKATTPYLWALSKLVRPRLTSYPPRAIRIPRPKQSVYKEPTDAWLYFDGSLSSLQEQTCVVLDIPGGGFVAMGPRMSEDKLLAWAGKMKVPILSIDYRKAPEYPYPYALNECYDVYHTIVATRGRCLGLSGKSPPKIVLTGESAGGNLAVGLTLMILQSGSTESRRWHGEDTLPAPDGLVLVYPSLNMRVESWMTEEQMSLIQETSVRKRNQNVLNRKNEEYRRITPLATPVASDERILDTSGPDYFKRKDFGGDKSTPQSTAETLKEAGQLAAPLQTLSPQIRTRLAVSSMISYVHDRILTPEMMRAMIILYIGPYNRPDFSTDFLLSPVLAPEALLARFPKTFLLTGERDPLVDDTVIFAGRLRQAKLHQFNERQELGLEKSQKSFNEKDHVDVTLIPGISHGFLQFAGFFPDSWKHINRCAKWIEELFTLAEASRLPSPTPSLTASTHQLKPRRHKRTPTGDSSADEDKPLEMGVSNIRPLTPLDGPGSSPAQAETEHPQSPNGRPSKAKRKDRPVMSIALPDLQNKDQSEGTRVKIRRERSFTSLASEEDLLDRRMTGLAGGLMGIGEGARTP